MQFAYAAPPPLTPDGQPAASGTATPAAPPDPAAKEKSRAAFRKGVAQIKANDWQGARASFEEAYSLVQHPSILLNLGLSRLKTGDPVLAEQDLTKFMADDPGASADEIASARDALADAKTKIGTLKIAATPPNASVKVDGAAAALKADGTADVRVKAGTHKITAEADGYAPVDQNIDVAGKAEVKVDVALASNGGAKPVDKPTDKPADDGSTNYRNIGGYALAGVAGAGLIATTIMGLRAISLSSDYSAKGTSTYQNQDTKSSGIAMRTGADVSLIIAILAGTGAAILLFTDIGKDAPDPPKPASASLPPFFIRF